MANEFFFMTPFQLQAFQTLPSSLIVCQPRMYLFSFLKSAGDCYNRLPSLPNTYT